MTDVFATKDRQDTQHLDWGDMTFLSCPELTGARDVFVMEVVIEPGQGHDFHRHPDQEEVITVIEGSIDHWIEAEHRTLVAGESVRIPTGTVHASFTVGDAAARLIVSLGPCVGEVGYEGEDVSAAEPWASLR